MSDDDGTEQDQDPGQGAEELEALEVDGEHDDAQPDLRGELREDDKYLAKLIRQGEAAGFGDQVGTLKTVRSKLGKMRQLVEQAETRARAQALAQYAADNGEAIASLRQAVRLEMTAELQRERSFGRLGLGPEHPARQLFADLPAGADHREFHKRADALHAAGVHWGDADPLVREAGQLRRAVWQEAIAQNGNTSVPGTSPPGMPPELHQRELAKAVGQMQATAAGGTPVNAEDLEGDIRKAHRNPGAYSQAELEGLAARFNADLDGLSHYLNGGA